MTGKRCGGTTMSYGGRLAGISKRGDVVLDPFGGAGTCAVECARLGRRFIHIDNSPLSIEITLARLRPFYTRKDFRVSVASWTRAGERELEKRRLGFLSSRYPLFGERSDRALPWDDGRNWLLLGDMLNWVGAMPAGLVDLIYADAPFATGIDFGAFDDRWLSDKPMVENLHLPDAQTEAKVYARIKRLTPLEIL